MSNRIGIVKSLLQHVVATLFSIEQSDEVVFSISQSFGSVSRWTCWSILLRALQGWNHDASQHDTFFVLRTQKVICKLFQVVVRILFQTEVCLLSDFYVLLSSHRDHSWGKFMWNLFVFNPVKIQHVLMFFSLTLQQLSMKNTFKWPVWLVRLPWVISS